MGRGRIKTQFRDQLRDNEPPPKKTHNFSASSIPNADPAVFRELKAGVGKVESRIGIDLPQGNLGFTTDGQFLGVEFGAGDARTVLLSRKFFNQNSKEIIRRLRHQFDIKFLTETTTPLQSVIVHELGHSIWVDDIEGINPRLSRLTKGIRSMYSQYKRDVSRGLVPVSRYADYNINEFFAETFTKAIIGKDQNNYSRRLLFLLRKYRKELKQIR